jgi:hypothetical protein
MPCSGGRHSLSVSLHITLTRFTFVSDGSHGVLRTIPTGKERVSFTLDQSLNAQLILFLD